MDDVERWYDLREQASAAQARIKQQTAALWAERSRIAERNWSEPHAVKRFIAIDRELAQLAGEVEAVKALTLDLERIGEQLGCYCSACDVLGRPCSGCAHRARKAAQAHGGAVTFAGGGAVKALSDTKVRALAVVWGGQDLIGDEFVRGVTDLGAGRSFVGMPVYYDHARGGVKSQIGQVVYADETEEGIVFDIELDRANNYFDTVKKLIQQRKLGASTGALGHLVVRKGGKLLRWICGELSLTPEAMEPRTMGRVAPV